MSEASVAGFQLSPQQKHVWMSAGEDSVPRAAVAILLEGAVDVARLKAALKAVVARHEILRTSFERRPGMKIPVQVVRDTAEPAWDQVDLRALAADQQKARVDELFGHEVRPSAVLNTSATIRASLLLMSDARSVLVVSAPALCADTASFKNGLTRTRTTPTALAIARWSAGPTRTA